MGWSEVRDLSGGLIRSAVPVGWAAQKDGICRVGWSEVRDLSGLIRSEAVHADVRSMEKVGEAALDRGQEY